MKNKKMGKVLFWVVLLGVFLVPGTIWARPNAYVVNRTDRTISVIDTATDAVIATSTAVGIVGGPTGIAISPNRQKIYVTDVSGNSVVVIDGNTYEYLTTIAMGSTTSGIVFNPDGTKVYAANFGASLVSVIDVATDTIETTIPVENAPVGMAIDPSGTHLYVGNYNSNSVSIINLLDNSVASLGTTINKPTGIIVLPTGDKFYIVQQDDINIYVFNTSDNSFVKTISAVDCVGNIVSNPLGTKIYVPGRLAGNVAIIDTSTDTLETTVPVTGTNPFGVSINPDGTRVYVTNTGSSNVSVVDTTINQVIDTISVDLGPVSFGNFIDPQSIVSFSSSPLSFDNTYIGKESTETLTITNTGTANLELGNLTESSSNFKIENDACSGQTLSLLETCTVDIIFEPQETSGTKSTSLIFTSNDPDQTTATLTLTGEAKYAKKFVTKSAKSKQVKIKKNTTRYANGLYFKFTKYPTKLIKSKHYLKIEKFKKYPKNYVDASNKTLKKYWRVTNDFYNSGITGYKFKITYKYTKSEFNKLKKKISGLKKGDLTIKFRTKDNVIWRNLNTNWQTIKIDAKNKKIVVEYFTDLKEKIYYFAIVAK